MTNCEEVTVQQTKLGIHQCLVANGLHWKICRTTNWDAGVVLAARRHNLYHQQFVVRHHSLYHQEVAGIEKGETKCAPESSSIKLDIWHHAPWHDMHTIAVIDLAPKEPTDKLAPKISRQARSQQRPLEKG